jgi:hypothetical protein
MASQVFSGTNRSNFTYTNNTGQNVRIIINYLQIRPASGIVDYQSANGTISAGYLLIYIGNNLPLTIGRNLAFYVAGGVAGNNAYTESNGNSSDPSPSVNGLPTELMLSSGEVFSINGGITATYNIVVIPEAG